MLHHPTPRREFLKRTVAAPAAAALVAARLEAALGTPDRPALPYVDGLSFFSGDPADIRASGLAAFICDVSAGQQIKTADGSMKFWRAFEPSLRSLTTTRRALARGDMPGTFLATRGSQVREAFDTARTAVFFQFQGGGEAVGEELWRLETFHELGLRVLQITHHNDNLWGGGSIERNWTGLTKLGHEGIERLNDLGIIPDLSHGSEPMSLDTLRVSRRPVIVSHSGARAIVPNARCTPDSVIRGVADSGGAFGVFMMSFWLTTDPVPTTEALLRQIRHVVKIGGIDAAAIANDYTIAGELTAVKAGNDNAKVIPNYYPWWDSVAKEGVLGFDTRPTHAVIPELNNVRRMFLIHEALEKDGYRDPEIEKIMGGNWIRVLTDCLG